MSLPGLHTFTNTRNLQTTPAERAAHQLWETDRHFALLDLGIQRAISAIQEQEPAGTDVFVLTLKVHEMLLTYNRRWMMDSAIKRARGRILDTEEMGSRLVPLVYQAMFVMLRYKNRGELKAGMRMVGRDLVVAVDECLALQQ